MNVDELRRLIADGENERLELKSGVPPPDVIAQHLAAFANTNGGVLLAGIKEPDIIVGVNLKRAEWAVQRARDFLDPKIDVVSEVIDVDEKAVLVLRVAPSAGLIASSGGYYCCCRLKVDQVCRLRIDQGWKPRAVALGVV